MLFGNLKVLLFRIKKLHYLETPLILVQTDQRLRSSVYELDKHGKKRKTLTDAENREKQKFSEKRRYADKQRDAGTVSGLINMMMDKHKLGNSHDVKSMIPFFQGGIDNSPTEYEHK